MSDNIVSLFALPASAEPPPRVVDPIIAVVAQLMLYADKPLESQRRPILEACTALMAIALGDGA